MGVKKIGDIVMVQLSDVDSNIYLIGDTVVDTGVGFNFIRLRDVLRVFKMPMDTVKNILNTHYHFDHIGGNGYFTAAQIAIHEADAPVLENGDAETSVAEFFGGNMHKMKVARKLKDGDVVKMGAREFQVVHTPGHTPGSICLYDKKDKTLISGDTVFANGVGRTDLPGGDFDQLKGSLQRLSKMDVQKILPGHGSVVEKDGTKVIGNLLKAAKPLGEDEEIDAFDNPV
ncbi:MAG: MBL fold metallo-hydrolase [Candidatus Aenigmarchaeota archaeon]|nr:MBL fold metallo-hydrolase [Candidatus Aenigmarchaeota archaeon]